MALVIAGLIILGAGAYVAMNPEVISRISVQNDNMEVGSTNGQEKTTPTPPEKKTVINWQFSDAGETDNIPYTNVSVVINNTPYSMGKFQGACAEIGAAGGIDGKGLLAGELSGAQCWFAGGGDEIGVFAHEDGGFDIMVGVLEEPIEGSAGFRGDFEIRQTIEL